MRADASARATETDKKDVQDQGFLYLVAPVTGHCRGVGSMSAYTHRNPSQETLI